MELLSRPFLGIPLWGWLAIAGIGIAAAVFLLPKFFGGTASLGSGPASNQANQPADPNIDPNTGVPYQVEEAINPNTGLPAYFSLFGQQQGNTTAGAGAGTNSTSSTASTTSAGAATATKTAATGQTPVVVNQNPPAVDATTGPHPTGITSPSIQVSDWGKINAYSPQSRGRVNDSAVPAPSAPSRPPARPSSSLPWSGWPRT